MDRRGASPRLHAHDGRRVGRVEAAVDHLRSERRSELSVRSLAFGVLAGAGHCSLGRSGCGR